MWRECANVLPWSTCVQVRQLPLVLRRIAHTDTAAQQEHTRDRTFPDVHVYRAIQHAQLVVNVPVRDAGTFSDFHHLHDQPPRGTAVRESRPGGVFRLDSCLVLRSTQRTEPPPHKIRERQATQLYNCRHCTRECITHTHTCGATHTFIHTTCESAHTHTPLNIRVHTRTHFLNTHMVHVRNTVQHKQPHARGRSCLVSPVVYGSVLHQFAG